MKSLFIVNDLGHARMRYDDNERDEGFRNENDEIGDVIMSSQGQPTRCLTSAPNRQTLTDEFYQWGQGYHASSILLRIARKLSQTEIEALASYLSYATSFYARLIVRGSTAGILACACFNMFSGEAFAGL